MYIYLESAEEFPEDRSLLCMLLLLLNRVRVIGFRAEVAAFERLLSISLSLFLRFRYFYYNI